MRSYEKIGRLGHCQLVQPAVSPPGAKMFIRWTCQEPVIVSR